VNKMLKIILIIIAVIVILFIAMIIDILRINTKELKQKEIILKGEKNKNALVLYQKSKHKTATNITNALAEELNQNGYTVTINHPSKKLNYNINDYDILAFGSAVYMGQISKPLLKYMDKISLKNKRVIVYAIGDATDVTTEVDLLKEKAKDALLVDGIKVKTGQESKIKEFVKEYLKKS